MPKLNTYFLFAFMVLPFLINAQTFQWAKAFGGIGIQQSTSIIADDSNSVIVTGWFENDVDLDPDTGSSLMSSAGYRDIFFAKYDQNGNHIWSHSFGGPFDDEGTCVITDDFNNIYLTGYFEAGSVDFDPGPSIYQLSTAFADMFIAKYDSSGNFIWAKNIPINNSYSSNAVSVDNNGDLYIVGSFYDTVDFDPGPGVINFSSNGYEDVFIIKLNSSGNVIWAKTIGGLYGDAAIEISFDNNNNLIATGTFRGTIDLNPGVGVYNKTALGNKDCFILKLTATGNFMWAKCIQGTGMEEPRDLRVDTQGNLIIAGIFTYIVDFDPGISIYADTSASLNYDFFILKLDSTGNFEWVYTNGDTIGDFCTSIQLDANNKIYALGGFTGTVDFDDGQGVYSLTSTDSADVYILKLNELGEFLWARKFGGGSTDVGLSNTIDNNGNIFSTGYFSGFVSFNPPNGSSISGNIRDFFITKHSTCLNSFASINVNSCDSFVSPSGNYTWITNGQYQDTIFNFNGCDSIIFVNLSILATTNITITPLSSTTFCQGDSVILSATAGLATYQWYNRNYSIPGATSISYTVKSRGKYKCIAQNVALCSDTSNFITVNVPCIPVGPNQQRSIENIGIESQHFQIFPNPGTGIFSVISPLGQLEVYNSIGRLILSIEISEEESSIDISEFSDGIYFISLKTEEAMKSHKIILLR